MSDRVIRVRQRLAPAQLHQQVQFEIEMVRELPNIVVTVLLMATCSMGNHVQVLQLFQFTQ